MSTITSGTDSNLSDPKYSDYDLVAAVTQASVQVAMTDYLKAVQQPEIIKCYVYNDTGAIVEIAYDELKSNAKGSDPFDLVDGQPQTDEIVQNLKGALFAGAFKARVGVPTTVPADQLPPIVTFQNGTTAPVIFNLMCSEFQIVGLEYFPPAIVKVINKSQPTDGKSLWYFTAHIDLNTSDADLNASGLPEAVQERIRELEHSAGKGAFSIQHLLIMLETAILLSQPKIVGVPQGWPVWILISQIFMTAYIDNLKKSGNPVLAYAAKVAEPDPSSLKLGAISHETLAYLVDGVQPTHPSPAQRDAATLVYIGVTSKNAPVAVPFKWNWVSTSDLKKIAGVMAVRRGAFFGWIKAKLDVLASSLWFGTTVVLSHSGENIHWNYSYKWFPSGPTFKFVENPTRDKDGWLKVLTFQFAHPSTDSTKNSTHTEYFYATFSSNVTGNVYAKGKEMRVDFGATVYIEFHHHEAGIHYTDLHGENWVDINSTATYTLGANEHGRVTVKRDSSFNNASRSLNWHKVGLEGVTGFFDSVDDTVTSVINTLIPAVRDTLADYTDGLETLINSAGGWVFPGADTFTTLDVNFSDECDLVTPLTYKSAAKRSALEAAATSTS